MFQMVFFPLGVIFTVIGVGILAAHVSRSDEDVLKALDLGEDEFDEDGSHSDRKRTRLESEFRLNLVGNTPYNLLYYDLPHRDEILQRIPSIRIARRGRPLVRRARSMPANEYAPRNNSLGGNSKAGVRKGGHSLEGIQAVTRVDSCPVKQSSGSRQASKSMGADEGALSPNTKVMRLLNLVHGTSPGTKTSSDTSNQEQTLDDDVKLDMAET